MEAQQEAWRAGGDNPATSCRGERKLPRRYMYKAHTQHHHLFSHTHPTPHTPPTHPSLSCPPAEVHGHHSEVVALLVDVQPAAVQQYSGIGKRDVGRGGGVAALLWQPQPASYCCRHAGCSSAAAAAGSAHPIAPTHLKRSGPGSVGCSAWGWGRESPASVVSMA